MKIFLYVIIFVLISTSISIFFQQQNQAFVCGDVGSTIYRAPQDRGGLYITSEGTLNALYIFIQFSDDNENTAGWPITNPISLPSWATNIAGQGKGITEYYNEMSNGVFNLTGYIYPTVYVPQHPQSYYSNLGEVNAEALTSLDSQIDYSQFDNWNGNLPGADGKVDMIFLIYRNFENRLWDGIGQGWTGLADLLLPSNLVLDGVTISKGFTNGSGLQMRGGKNGFNYTQYVAAHEFGHHLFGGGHIYGVSNLALMTSGPVWNASRGMISWEREKLNWIDYQDKSSDDIIYVDDYMTTGDIYRIPISSTEYYVIENRQKISIHDYAGDKGIYIYHITGANYNLPFINVECADGNWNFDFNTSTKVITRVDENRNGKDEMDYQHWYNGQNYACFIPNYFENSAWGDDEDAFDLTFNDVFSPVSNPSSSNFTVEIKQLIGNQYKVQLYFTNPYAGKPSKVVNFSANFTGVNPTFTWETSNEPDWLNYRVYKKLYTVSSGTMTSYTVTTATNYIDLNFTIGGGKFSRDNAEYWVVAVDSDNNISVDTKHYSTNGTSGLQWKIGYNENQIISTYKLIQNYPNPFNPSTQIRYELPQNSFVRLQVFNTLGQEVVTLVNDVQESGIYEVNFNADNLPSGIYIYKIEAGEFSDVKKMLLLK